jgi:hypothetical protein
VVLVAAAFWLFFCTYMFHGVLEGQLSLSDSAEVRQVAPTERECGGWARSWCEQRVAQHRAAAVRKGMQHAWAGYKAYAWGADEIHPQSKTAKTDIMVRLQAAGSLAHQAQHGTSRCNMNHARPTSPPAGRRGRVWHGRQHRGCAVHAEDHGPRQRVRGVSGPRLPAPAASGRVTSHAAAGAVMRLRFRLKVGLLSPLLQGAQLGAGQAGL